MAAHSRRRTPASLVARALAQETPILVLDEPTASLDFGNQVRVLDAVRSLAETHGLTVLLSTHHPEQAFACADRVAVLAGGELLQIGAPAEVVTAETLRACYAVEVAVLPVAAAATAYACRGRTSADRLFGREPSWPRSRQGSRYRSAGRCR